MKFKSVRNWGGKQIPKEHLRGLLQSHLIKRYRAKLRVQTRILKGLKDYATLYSHLKISFKPRQPTKVLTF